MPINPMNMAQLKRIDDNLMILKDRADEAERVTGQGRSNFINGLSLDPHTSKSLGTPNKKPEKKVISIKVMVEVDGDEVSIVKQEQEIEVDMNDPLKMRELLKKKRFSLLDSRFSAGLLTA